MQHNVTPTQARRTCPSRSVLGCTTPKKLSQVPRSRLLPARDLALCLGARPVRCSENPSRFGSPPQILSTSPQPLGRPPRRYSVRSAGRKDAPPNTTHRRGPLHCSVFSSTHGTQSRTPPPGQVQSSFDPPPIADLLQGWLAESFLNLTLLPKSLCARSDLAAHAHSPRTNPFFLVSYPLPCGPASP